MRTIRISEEVWKQIAKRGSFGETPDDVLKREFKISETPPLETVISRPVVGFDRPVVKSDGSFNTGGAVFPNNTKFRMRLGGEYKYAQVKNGALVVNEQRFNSVSRAAMDYTKYEINGWDVWQCQFPNETGWQPIDSLRPGPVRQRRRLTR